jgi:hypothetical protein
LGPGRPAWAGSAGHARDHHQARDPRAIEFLRATSNERFSSRGDLRGRRPSSARPTCGPWFRPAQGRDLRRPRCAVAAVVRLNEAEAPGAVESLHHIRALAGATCPSLDSRIAPTLRRRRCSVARSTVVRSRSEENRLEPRRGGPKSAGDSVSPGGGIPFVATFRNRLEHAFRAADRGGSFPSEIGRRRPQTAWRPRGRRFGADPDPKRGPAAVRMASLNDESGLGD